MSMKLRSSLMGSYRSKIEQSYMRESEIITLQGVPCEMEFEAEDAWVEHEGADHHYLPYIHFVGRIKNISGNFPYNVSSLSFSESDSETKLREDMLYYMNLDELSHMVKTGKFYTKDFELPEILTKNTYYLPATVNLAIIPPPRPEQYEAASFREGLTDVSVNGIEKDNLPIFYTEVTGTGLSKEDEVVRLYDLSFDNDFKVMAMTAEHSGYDKGFAFYVVEPVVEKEEEMEVPEELYLTPEEEAEMIRQQQAEQEPEVPTYHPEDDLQRSEEDVFLADAYKNVDKRVDKAIQARMTKQMQRQQEAQAEQQVVLNKNKDLSADKAVQKESEEQATRLASLEKLMQAGKVESAIKKPGKGPDVSALKPKTLGYDQAVNAVKEEPVQAVSQDMHIVKEEPVVAVDVTKSAEAPVAATEPDVPQQQAEVKMDLNPEANMETHPELDKDANGIPKESEERAEDLAEENEESGTKLRDANGADVSDARLQAKIDEANAQENARQTAVDIHQDMHEAKEQQSGRQVDASLAGLADVQEQRGGAQFGD